MKKRTEWEQEVTAKLAAKFPRSELEFRINWVDEQKAQAIVLAFVDNRAIMKRLDEVFGPFGWRNEFRHENGGVLCGISIWYPGDGNGRNGEWITKWDGAPPSNIDAFKGGLSGSMKRAGVHWIPGCRKLYELKNYPALWCKVRKRGRNWEIIDPPELPPEFYPEGDKAPPKKEQKDGHDLAHLDRDTQITYDNLFLRAEQAGLVLDGAWLAKYKFDRPLAEWTKTYATEVFIQIRVDLFALQEGKPEPDPDLPVAGPDDDLPFESGAVDAPLPTKQGAHLWEFFLWYAEGDPKEALRYIVALLHKDGTYTGPDPKDGVDFMHMSSITRSDEDGKPTFPFVKMMFAKINDNKTLKPIHAGWDEKRQAAKKGTAPAEEEPDPLFEKVKDLLEIHAGRQLSLEQQDIMYRVGMSVNDAFCDNPPAVLLAMWAMSEGDHDLRNKHWSELTLGEIEHIERQLAKEA